MARIIKTLFLMNRVPQNLNMSSPQNTGNSLMQTQHAGDKDKSLFIHLLFFILSSTIFLQIED